MSLWMTGDNYTSDRSQTLQSAVKTAGAIAVREPLDDNVTLWVFFPAILPRLDPSGPLHIHTFSYGDAAMAAVASGCSVI